MRKQSKNLLLVLVLLAALVLVLNLSACAKKTQADANEPYSVEYNHTVYTITPVDENTGTISDGTNTYTYQYEPHIPGYSVKFTYPDGETYTWTDDGNNMSGTTSQGFDFDQYPDGWTLSDILLQNSSAKNAHKTGKNVALIFILLAVGAVNAVWPKATWYLEMGWKIRDAEPSEAALGWNRGIGIVAVVIAVIMIII